MIKVELRGVNDIVDRISRYPAKVQRSSLRKSARKAMRIVQKAARDNARQLDDPSTKNSIYKNIALQESRRGSRAVGGVMMRVGVRGGARKATADKSAAGGDTYYWRFLEFGTQKMRARPFMRPALENNVQAVADTFTATMRSELDRP